VDFTIGEYLNLIDYKITEGYEFGWNCFGPNAYSYEWYNSEVGSLSIEFGTIDRLVYMVNFVDLDSNSHYWINDAFADAYKQEYCEHIAWDDEDTATRYDLTEFRELLNHIFKGEK
jgi:hypothetical protein